MRALAIRLLALTVTATNPPGRSEAAPPPSVVQAVALVARRNRQTEAYLPIGTAFHVGGRLFRTAAHVATVALSKRFEGRGLDEFGLFQADVDIRDAEQGCPTSPVAP
jgi:hypothetical protein